VALVSPDFLDIDWDATPENSDPSIFSSMNGSLQYFAKPTENSVQFLTRMRNQYQTNSSGLVYLGTKDCINTYASGFVQQTSDVMLVTRLANRTQPVLWTRYQEHYRINERTNPDPFRWMCVDFHSEKKWNKSEVEKEILLRSR
jgi:hypothetical protein